MSQIFPLAFLLVLATGSALARARSRDLFPPIYFEDEYGFESGYLRQDRGAEDTKPSAKESAVLKKLKEVNKEKIPKTVQETPREEIVKNDGEVIKAEVIKAEVIKAEEIKSNEGSDNVRLTSSENNTETDNNSTTKVPSTIDFLYDGDDDGEVVSPQMPKLIGNDQEKIALIKPGENITLTCRVRGFPTPKVVWLKNDKEAATDLTHEVTEAEELDHSILARLFINHCDCDDVGMYSCIAANFVGKVTKAIVLEISDCNQ